MATNTHAEVDTAVYLDEGGLDDFEPEAQRTAPLWLRAPGPTAADVRRWEPYVAPPRTRLWPFVTPVLLAGVIAGAAVSWLGVAKSEERRAPAPAAPSAAPRMETAVEPPFTLAPPAVAVSPASPAAEPAAPREPVSAAGTPREPAPAVAAPIVPRLDPSIEQTLAAVSRSYRDLDAASLAAVWPGAASESLTQNFSALKYQTLSFDRCQSRPNGPESAVASCEVSIAAAAKAGDPTLQRRRESWTIVMNREGDRWTIAGVTRVAHP
jgi:hypothetical protein